MFRVRINLQIYKGIPTGMKIMRYVSSLFCFFLGLGVFWLLSTEVAQGRPSIMLAQSYHSGLDVKQYWVSEKLDGVRARWDGKQLISRGGKSFAPPPWFVKGFPEQALDGELWISRGRYEDVMSIVTKTKPHEGWRQVRLMIFDLPENPGRFEERVAAMRKLAERTQSNYLQLIEQFRVPDEEALMQRLDAVIAAGGEGLMLHHTEAVYRSGRSEDLLKLKRFDDAEAVVIGYKSGKGKYQGMVGSLKVRREDGREFYIGSGLADSQRRQPPAIGSVVTYRFQGLTGTGLPRFPVFLRERKPGL
jgi:DNA ligase-1